MMAEPIPPNKNGKSNFERFVECVEAYAEGVNRTLAFLFQTLEGS